MATEVEPGVGSFEVGSLVCLKMAMLPRFQKLVAFVWRGKEEKKLTDSAKRLWQAERELGEQQACQIRAKADLPDCVFVTVNGFDYPSAISIHWFQEL